MGPAGYTVVCIVLGAWFVWLMSRMAAFADEGSETLVRLGAALAVAVVVPTLLLGIFRLIDRLRSRDR